MHSLGNGQEGDRDQPVPARDHGRRCRYVLSSFSLMRPKTASITIEIPARSRLPVLGNLPRHPVPVARVAEPRTDLGRGGEQVPLEPRLLVQGHGPLDGDHDLRLGQDGEKRSDPNGRFLGRGRSADPSVSWASPSHRVLNCSTSTVMVCLPSHCVEGVVSGLIVPSNPHRYSLEGRLVLGRQW